MILETTTWKTPYEFEVILFKDDEEDKIIYLIKLTNDDSAILAEKISPGGKWVLIQGDFAGDLQDAIFHALDECSFNRLMNELKPIELMGEYYNIYNQN